MGLGSKLRKGGLTCTPIMENQMEMIWKRLNTGLYKGYMSYSLNSSKGVLWEIIEGTNIGRIRVDTRSFDFRHLGLMARVWGLGCWV